MRCTCILLVGGSLSLTFFRGKCFKDDPKGKKHFQVFSGERPENRMEVDSFCGTLSDICDGIRMIFSGSTMVVT